MFSTGRPSRPAGNRIWRQNTVATSLGKAFDEFYWYDGIHRLKDMQRGTLNAGKTGITPGTSTFAECWGLDTIGNWSNYRQDDNGVRHRDCDAQEEQEDRALLDRPRLRRAPGGGGEDDRAEASGARSGRQSD